jgi:hypothetical protein
MVILENVGIFFIFVLYISIILFCNFVFNLNFSYSMEFEGPITESISEQDGIESSSLNGTFDPRRMQETNSCIKLPNSTAATIAIETTETVYTPDQNIPITIYIYDTMGCKISSPVDLQITEVTTPDKIVYTQSFFSSINMEDNGFTSEQSIGLNNPGKYNISASIDGEDGPMISWKIIEIKEIFYSKQALMGYISIGFFICLMILAVSGIRNRIISEILRFIFISGIIFAPVGIVKKPPQIMIESPEGFELESMGENALGDGEWVINIGGQPPDYRYGIQIPISVLIFGILGGYLRYLYKTSKILTNARPIGEKDDERLILFYHSLEDIALLFLAPLLAMAVWFLLTQAGVQGEGALYTIAVVSFTVGLITEEVIQSLIRFTSSALKSSSKNETKE